MICFSASSPSPLDQSLSGGKQKRQRIDSFSVTGGQIKISFRKENESSGIEMKEREEIFNKTAYQMDVTFSTRIPVEEAD